MRLFVGTSPATVIAKVGIAVYRTHFGKLNGPRDGHNLSMLSAWGVPWALDNDAFNGFDEGRYISMLKRYHAVPGCVFAAAPDVVADASATLGLFARWQPIIRAYEYPIALVAQDGLEYLSIPWDQFDALFIGGSTVWKLGTEAASIAREAKARGKWLHMGRVNSARRMRYAQALECDSIDGSGYARFPIRTLLALPTLQSCQWTLWENF